jgi:DNA-binding IclR family transcriptional regulator
LAGNTKDPGRSVTSKISAILLALGEGAAHTLTEIATRSRLPLSTTHRLVTELADWGVLERGEDGYYRCGLPLRVLAGADTPSRMPVTASRLRERAVPVMEDLFRATGMAVRIGWPAGLEVAYAEKLVGHTPVSRPSAAARLPMHASALGKALLAFSSSGVVNAVISSGLKRYTGSTITRPERLRWTLSAIRTTHLAVCCSELDRNWCGVAAPVFGPGGEVLAAIELRVSDVHRDVPAVQPLLLVATGSLSRELTRSSQADPAVAWRDTRPELVPVPGGRTAAVLSVPPTQLSERSELA